MDVRFEAPAPTVKSLEIAVKQHGTAVVTRTFPWPPRQPGLGIFLPDGVSGAAQVVGRAFDGSGAMTASGEEAAEIVPGKVSEVVNLVMRAGAPPPDAAMPDGGAPDEGADQDQTTEASPDNVDATDDGDLSEGGRGDVSADESPDQGPGDQAGSPDGPADAGPRRVVIPAGYGRYCSVLYELGGWDVFFVPDLTMDPCQYLRDRYGPGTVERAGVYSTLMKNSVVVRCETGGSWVSVTSGIGQEPLEHARNMARDNLHKSCVVTAAPDHLEVFGTIFHFAPPPYGHGSGFDFARLPYQVLDLSEFGTSDVPLVSYLVNSHARDRGCLGFIDNSDGHDFLMPSGTPIVAVADGTVMAARFRNVSRACTGVRNSDSQGEVFIKHVLGAGANSTEYDEVLVTYYAHLSTIAVSEGQPVTRGQVIGESGDTGCATEPKLHLSVYRLTNTAGWRLFPFTVNADFGAGQDQKSSNGDPVLIDPFGFQSPKGFDPWATRAYPMGALSIYLWRTDPGGGDW